MTRIETLAFLVASVGIAAAAALAQPAPDYDFQWATVGAPGNRPTNPDEVGGQDFWKVGSVNYTFRMTNTEVTYAQYAEFVNAYIPYYPYPLTGSEFLGWFLRPTDSSERVWQPVPGTEQWPAEMGWRYAARFCNWLHNGKGTSQSAFESGAYDTSTFTVNADGSYNDQREHSPGAKFWIPTRNEWIKGAYYDPDRYGPGVGGYWQYPNRSNNPLLSGLPEAGGETNAGPGVTAGLQGMSVGSYPGVVSPWGLKDLSGGVEEWTEDQITASRRSSAVLGSTIRDTDYLYRDNVANMGLIIGINHANAGFRMSSIVPAPATSVVIAFMTWAGLRRRSGGRRHVSGGPSSHHVSRITSPRGR